MDTLTLDDIGPMPVLRPGSVPELTDLVRNHEAVFSVGGRTMLGLGRQPGRAGTAIDTRNLDQLIDYPARDMTVTIQAGMTVARLAELLASERQRLPIDVPRSSEATVGGIIAANVSGPRRFGFGTLRDYVIGLSAVYDDAVEAKAGGRVVKNVAGYDLPKLHIGALGTLGIITQVTFKLRPLPEQSALVVFGCDGPNLAGVLDRLHTTRTRPVVLDVLNRAAADSLGVPLPAGEFVVVVGFEEKATTVAWQTKQLHDELAGGVARDVTTLAAPADAPLWQALIADRLADDTAATLKASLLPAQVAAFLTATATDGVRWHAHAGNGIAIGHLPTGTTLETAESRLAAIRSALGQPSSLIVERCPTAWKTVLPVWGEAPGEQALMRAVKRALDPKQRFNPGRYIDP